MLLDNEKNFLYELGYTESKNNYNPPGNPNYWGKYQFGIDQLRTLGNYFNVDIPTKEYFLGNPAVQEMFMQYQIQYLINRLTSNNLLGYIGTDITGQNKYKKTVPIDIYGLIAGAHLGGVEGLRLLLELNLDHKDSNDTYVSDYVAHFSDLKKNISVYSILFIAILSFIIFKK